MKISIEITGSPHRGPGAITSLAGGMAAGAVTSLLLSLLRREPHGRDEEFDDCDGKGPRRAPFDISVGFPKDDPPASGGDGLMNTLASVLSSLGPILAASMASRGAAPTTPTRAPQIGKCPWCGGEAVSLVDPGLVDKLVAESFECATCKKLVKASLDQDSSTGYNTTTFVKVEDEPVAPAPADTAR